MVIIGIEYILTSTVCSSSSSRFFWLTSLGFILAWADIQLWRDWMPVMIPPVIPSLSWTNIWHLVMTHSDMTYAVCHWHKYDMRVSPNTHIQPFINLINIWHEWKKLKHYSDWTLVRQLLALLFVESPFSCVIYSFQFNKLLSPVNN